MTTEIENAKEVLKKDGVILYPTDTIWGLGCLSSSEVGFEKIFKIKNRPQNKSVIILVSGFEMLTEYVENISDIIFNYLNSNNLPTTVIYKASIKCPKHLVAQDGTIAIRIPKDEFCKQLINSAQEPITSTSANISSEKNPSNFQEINKSILQKVDYIVNWRQDDKSNDKSSEIIKFEKNNIIKIR